MNYSYKRTIEMLNFAGNKEEMTPLGQNLLSSITEKGPLTVAEFMEHALGHPEYGYYQTKFAV